MQLGKLAVVKQMNYCWTKGKETTVYIQDNKNTTR